MNFSPLVRRRAAPADRRRRRRGARRSTVRRLSVWPLSSGRAPSAPVRPVCRSRSRPASRSASTSGLRARPASAMALHRLRLRGLRLDHGDGGHVDDAARPCRRASGCAPAWPGPSGSARSRRRRPSPAPGCRRCWRRRGSASRTGWPALQPWSSGRCGRASPRRQRGCRPCISPSTSSFGACARDQRQRLRASCARSTRCRGCRNWSATAAPPSARCRTACMP